MLFDLLLLCLLISSVWGCKKKQDYYNIIMILIFYIFLDKVVRKKKHGNKLIEGAPGYQDRLTAWLQDRWPSIATLTVVIWNGWTNCVTQQKGRLEELVSHGRGVYDSSGGYELRGRHGYGTGRYR